MAGPTLIPDSESVELEELVADDAGVTFVVRASRPTACCPDCEQPATRVHRWYERRLGDLHWQGLAPARAPVHAPLVLRRAGLHAAHLHRAVPGARPAPRAAHGAARHATYRPGLCARWAARCASPCRPRSGRQPRHPHQYHPAGRPPARADPARAGCGRLELSARAGVRDDPRRFGATLPCRRPPRPYRGDLRRLAQGASGRRGHRARPGRGLRGRRTAGGARRYPGRRPVPPRQEPRRGAERLLDWHHAALRTAARAAAAAEAAPLPASPSPETPSPRPADAPPARPPTRAQRELAQRHARREARYDEIHRLLAQGLGLRAVARQLGLGRDTVRRMARAERCPQYRLRLPRPGVLPPHEAYLRERWAAGSGTPPSSGASYVSAASPARPASSASSSPAGAMRRGARGRDHARTCPPRQIAWLLRRADEDLSPRQAAFLAQLLEHWPDATAARRLAVPNTHSRGRPSRRHGHGHARLPAVYRRQGRRSPMLVQSLIVQGHAAAPCRVGL